MQLHTQTFELRVVNTAKQQIGMTNGVWRQKETEKRRKSLMNDLPQKALGIRRQSYNITVTR